MPLIKDINAGSGTRIAVWRIEEPLDFFRDQLVLSGSEQALVERYGTAKQLEWMATRYALDQIIDHHKRIETGMHPTGKPYLVGRDEEISLSHSGDCVAAIAGKVDVGIDIQVIKKKIVHLEKKFASDVESAQIDRNHELMYLHVLWCAKETLYKIYGRKQLSFREHLSVNMPEKLTEDTWFTGSINNGQEHIDCTLNFSHFDNYVLVHGQKL